jgi:uncharacterized protein with FMN-binding domain
MKAGPDVNRRIVASVLGTVVGLVVLLAVKSGPTPGGATAIPGATAPGSGTTTDPGSGTSTTGPSPTGGGSAATASSLRNGTFTGNSADTRYGPVKVRITVSGGRISAVDVVDVPQGNPRDVEINNFAVPVLQNETLSTQSAQIDFVSGATFTSDGYTRSLQSALDKAKR